MAEDEVNFDDSFLENLPNDPSLAGKKICDAYVSFDDFITPDRSEQVSHYEQYLKAYALLITFLAKYGIDIGVQEPDLGGNAGDNITGIRAFFRTARTFFEERTTTIKLEGYMNLFVRKLTRGLSYTFSVGDVKRIQDLLNQLRDLIVNTEELLQDHKDRLLRKLEKLQSELHKTMSDLDRFWGFIIEVSSVLQLIGERAKPILECVQEIAKIVWLAQAIAFGLPSNAPLQLPGCSPEKADAEDT